MNIFLSSFLIVLVILTGCTKLGPNFTGVREEVSLPKEWAKEENVTDAELIQWWQLFDDETLSKLIETAYEKNYDLKNAGLRILQARAALGISEALIYPQVQTLSGNLVSSYQNSNNVNAAGLNFDIGWEIDFWGKYARGIEASEAQLYSQVSSYRNILTTLVAEVARNYINYRTAQERIIYVQRNIAIQERVTQMTEVQFNSGNVSELDMQQARTQLYNTRATLPNIELSKIKARNALAVLLSVSNEEMDALLQLKNSKKTGHFFSKENVIQLNEDLGRYYNSAVIPVAHFDPYSKLDASLLQRRPDVQVAQFQARVASANVGKIEALLYPSFSLVGNIGYNTNDATGTWISAGDAIGVSAGPAFSWNIFQYDRIKNQIRIRDAALEVSLNNYNKTVLNAIRDVDDALNGYILTNKQLLENEKALKANLRAFNLSAVQYKNGLVSYQRLLSTVEKLTLIQDRYAQLKGLASLNTVLFYKSLGGGWQMSEGKTYISKETKQHLQSHGTDWGDYLDDTVIHLPPKDTNE